MDNNIVSHHLQCFFYFSAKKYNLEWMYSIVLSFTYKTYLCLSLSQQFVAQFQYDVLQILKIKNSVRICFMQYVFVNHMPMQC